MHLIQAWSPKNVLGGIVAARNIQMVLILISGEFIFARTATIFNLNHELIARATISAFIFLGTLIFIKFNKLKFEI